MNLFPIDWNTDDGSPYSSYCFSAAVFTPEECKLIIDSFGKELTEAQVAGSDGLIVNSKIRRSQVKWITYDSYSEWIFMRLKQAADDINKRFYKLDLRAFEEPLQLTRYLASEKGHYDWHKDFGNGEMVKRKLSQVLLLSDPSSFKGGKLTMSTGEVTELKQGTLVQFPSYEEHRVSPVTKGERWSLVSWISGPRFR